MENNHLAQPPGLRDDPMVVPRATWASRVMPLKHPKRIGFASLLAWALAVAVTVGILTSPALGQEAPEEAKARIMQLLSQLHDASPQTAAQAKTALEEMGLRQEDIVVGWKLRHPDAAVRKELAQELARAASPEQAELVLELTKDPERSVRLAALEAARKLPNEPVLLERVRQIASSDGDPIVRGNARLLAAELRAGVAPPARSEPLPEFPVIQPQPAASDPFAQTPSHRPPGPRTQLNPGDFAAPSEAQSLPSMASQSSLVPVQPFWKLSPTNDGTEPPAATREPSGPVGSFWEKEREYEDGVRHAAAEMEGDLATANQPAGPFQDVNPDVLNRPFRDPFVGDPSQFVDPIYEETGGLLLTEFNPPNGFAGPSSILPREFQTSSHFVPVEDRWRIGYPEWDRYGRGHPFVDDYPYIKGNFWDPYNQNVLKGDYPIVGQHTFMNVTIQNRFIQNFQKNPIGTTPFESTRDPAQEEFFGRPRNFLNQNYLSAQFDLFHAVTAAFKPLDWQLRLQPIFNRNQVEFQELAVVNPDVRKGTHRVRYDFSLEQYFIEAKLADLGPDYDFLSTRVGSQFFNSDFRGFVFSDINRGVRLFGTNFGNRDQFNLILFDQLEKETNSQLNTWDDRHQNVLIANYYRQDFIFPGYTGQVSYHYNNDNPSFKFDENNFLVRPDPVGVFEPHRVEAHYFGFAGDGHIGRINVTNQFYWVTGHDSKNPLANEKQDINAYMYALELSIDRDWMRFRTSYFYSSGDDDLFDDTARGFDTILDNPNFAGGEFSYWQRQAVRLFGVNLVQNNSIVPNLRSSKIQGQSNFVNPGLQLVNAGVDFEVTPKMKLITNANYMWFATTEPLEVFTFQDRIDPEIGLDLSMGIEYRPFLNDNMIIIGGIAALIPGKGFDDLFGTAIPEIAFGGDDDIEANQLYSNFIELILQY